ncbi:MAG TPA: hemolysin family protein [Anaerolineaceae bacterium]|nr:hemolysin family protein [Anaerolineaceae bacterium]
MLFGLEILLIFILILVNGLFSMYEMSMVSSRKVRLEQMEDDGDESAKTALRLLSTPNRYLSTVQLVITLISILSGAFGGARLAKPLGAFFLQQGWFGKSAEGWALIFIVILVTFFSLVLGELVPKRIALGNPERIAARFSGVMNVIAQVARPIVWFLSTATNFSLKLFNVKQKSQPVVTAEEIKLLIEAGAEQGIFEAKEQDMVSAVFRFGDRRVDAIMTPRTDVVWIDLDDTKPEIINGLKSSAFSRVPVAHGSLDQVVGMVYLKDLIGVDMGSPEFNLQDFAQEPLYVLESTSALHVFDQFRQTGKHQALVLDEYGGVQGIVSLYDVLESIMGDIPNDELDIEQDAFQREDGSWLFDGLLPIDELKEKLDLDELPDESRAGYHTLSGFVMNQLGAIPRIGQSFIWDNLRFEVVDMDGHRVDRVMVSAVPTDNSQPSA